MDLTVTIASYNTRNLLAACLRSLESATEGSTVEVHVVDNASTDGSAAMVERDFPHVKLIRNCENVGFARANNQSWSLSCGRYWLLLNSDTEVMPGALDRLVEFMDGHPQAGMATAKLLNPDGSPQLCAQPDPTIWRVLLEMSRLHKLLPASVRGRLLLSSYWSYDRPIPVGWTWGTALIARREAVEQVGPLSEEFFMYGEDVEWSLRMRKAGWQVWFCPGAEVVHYGGQSAAACWANQERSTRIAQGFEQALQMLRGRFYSRAYRMAQQLATAIESLRAKLHRRKKAWVIGSSNES